MKQDLMLESTSTRRGLLSGALGLGAIAAAACAAPASSTSTPSTTGSDCPPGGETTVDPFASIPARTVDVTGLPYRQDDPAWADNVMWDRDLVIRAATEVAGESRATAEQLLREFEDGNTIGNEGCLLTCLAMALRLLDDRDAPADWTPATLNAEAHYAWYYTPSGLSMTTLYADLVSEVSEGRVQLCLKEEFLPGVRWPRVTAQSSALVRAYRRLPPGLRGHFAVMLKTGTYDDTVASHYVLIHPHESESVDETDLLLLDPAQPLGQTGPWRLSDSARWITQDPDIAAGWAESAIEPTQLGGVWVFARCGNTTDRSIMGPFVRAWAEELAAQMA